MNRRAVDRQRKRCGMFKALSAGIPDQQRMIERIPTKDDDPTFGVVVNRIRHVHQEQSIGKELSMLVH